MRSLIRKGVARLTEPRGRVYEVVTEPERESLPETVAALLSAFEQQETLPNRVLREIWGLSPTSAYERAKNLVEIGWLERIGSGRAASYRLTERAKNARV